MNRSCSRFEFHLDSPEDAPGPTTDVLPDTLSVEVDVELRAHRFAITSWNGDVQFELPLSDLTVPPEEEDTTTRSSSAAPRSRSTTCPQVPGCSPPAQPFVGGSRTARSVRASTRCCAGRADGPGRTLAARGGRRARGVAVRW